MIKKSFSNIEWIILATDHYKISRSFYKNTLGLTIIRETPKEEFTQFKLDNCFLAIYGRKQMEKLVGKKYIGNGGAAIYTLKEVEDVDKYYQELKNQGVKFIKKPTTQPWGQRTAYFLDPDYHIWEIQQWVNKS